MEKEVKVYSFHTRSAFLVWLFSILSIGIYALYLHHAIAKECNIICKEDGKRTRGLLLTLLFGLLTFTVYWMLWTFFVVLRRKNFLESKKLSNNIGIGWLLLNLFLGITVIIPIIVFVKKVHQHNRIITYYQNLQSKTA